MTTSLNGVGAFNATVRTNEPDHITQAAREQRADDMQAAVEHIEQLIADLEGDDTADPKWRKQRLADLRTVLEAAEAEAVTSRAEAQRGN